MVMGRPKKYEEGAKQFSLYLPVPLVEKIDRYAKERGLSRNETTIVLLSSAKEEFSNFLLNKWKAVSELIEKHRRELAQLKSLLAPGEMLKHIVVDEEVKALFGQYCEEKKIKPEKVRNVYRYVRHFMLEDFTAYLEGKGYVVKSRDMLRAFLIYKISEMQRQIFEKEREKKPLVKKEVIKNGRSRS